MNTKGAGLNRTPQADSPGILTNTNRTKLLQVGRASSVIANSVRCVLHITGEVKRDAFVNSALFRFTTCLGLRNTTQLVNARLSACIFFNTGWVQEFHLYIQIVRIL